MGNYTLAFLLLILPALVHSQNASFTFSNFSSISNLLILGETVVSADGTLHMTYNKSGATGPYFISRVLHTSPLFMHNLAHGLAASFSTSFTFSISAHQTDIVGDGFAFILAPNNLLPHTQSASAGSLGLFDTILYTGSNQSLLHIVAIEYDTFVNTDYEDPDDHHVGLDINSLTSTLTSSLPSELVLKTTNSSRRLTTWIDYDAAQQQLDVYLAVAPAVKASAAKVLNYSNFRMWDYVNSSSYVGFTAGTGIFEENNTIYEWKFSSQLVSVPIPPPPPTPLSPPSPASSNTKRNVLIAVITSCSAILLLVMLFTGWKRLRMYTVPLRLDVDLMMAPRKFTYRELQLATGDFKEELGRGGSGDVFKGVITTKTGGVEHLAVKRIVKPSKQGEKEFKAEILTIGKLRHRNLVHLLGWCGDSGKLMLVYQFMPNGSLDKLLYSSSPRTLSWPLRFNIVKGVAAALVYLHVDWEKMIIHRDIKASNVLLDVDLNARLGDFGLARFFDHDQYCTQASATGIAGTFGYIAPEYAMSGRVTRESDIFSFGILALEVACGRRPFSNTDESLLDFVWRKHEEGELMDVADRQMQGEFDGDEMRCMLHIGLLCTHPDPKARLPTRRVLQILSGETQVPELPSSRPTAIYVQVETSKVYRGGILTSLPAYSSAYDLSSSMQYVDELSGPR